MAVAAQLLPGCCLFSRVSSRLLTGENKDLQIGEGGKDRGSGVVNSRPTQIKKLLKDNTQIVLADAVASNRCGAASRECHHRAKAVVTTKWRSHQRLCGISEDTKVLHLAAAGER